MSTTHTAAEPHALIKRIGARTGVYHAALWDGTAWRTACGDRMTDGPRGVIHSWHGQEATDELTRALAAGAAVCARCDRVGGTVAS